MKWKILLAMILLALFPVFMIDPNPKAPQQSFTLQEPPAAVPNPAIAPALRLNSEFRILIYEADPSEEIGPVPVQYEQQEAPPPQQEQPQQVEPERGYGWGYYWWWWIIIGGIIIFFIIIFAAWGGWGGGRRGGGPPPPDDRDRM
jgi:hypothetical protein